MRIVAAVVFAPLVVGLYACGSSGTPHESGADGSVPDARHAVDSGKPRDASPSHDSERPPSDSSEPSDSGLPPPPPRDASPDASSDASHDASHDDVHPPPVPDAGASTAPTGLHTVPGTGGQPGHIVDGAGNVVKLHGADRSGTEFACTYEAGGSASDGFPGFFDGLNTQAGVAAMAAWKINAVRVPLNEDCWLGINGYPNQDTAAHYQAAILQWVSLLNKNGMVAILDLHWAAPGTEATSTTIGQLPMADLDHAPAFWTSVAGTFKGNSSVIFDLFNEPYITDWTCWTQGDTASGTCAQDKSGNTYAVAGMANLLQAVRQTGAKNVVIMGGLSYSSDFTSWVSSVNGIPSLAAPLNGITLENVAASWHAYDFNSEQSGCPSQYNGYNSTCNSAATTATNTKVSTVLAAGFPLIIGESGISAYSSSTAQSFSASQITEIETWIDGLFTWAEGQGQSYIGWSWNTDTPPNLVTDYMGTPSPDWGVTYKAHLAGL